MTTTETEWRAEPNPESGYAGFWRVVDGPVVLSERLTEAQAKLIAATEELADALEAMMKGNKPPDHGSVVWNSVRMPNDMNCSQAQAALTKAGRAPQ